MAKAQTTTTETTTTIVITLPELTTTSITALPLPTTTTTTVTLPPACVPGAPGQCDDHNPCTRDSCDGAFLTCLHIPESDTPCGDDGVFCTDDRCVLGTCQHVPSDLRCDSGECMVRACQPAAFRADRRGCVTLRGRSRREGAPCTADGFSCTDDVCMRGACLHVPIDGRCVASDVCSASTCAPTARGHDATGCAVGPARSDGETCSEDADVCTLDVCRGTICQHEPEPDVAECSPVQDVFRQTIALGTMTDELGSDLQRSSSPALAPALARLDVINGQLAETARALAGDMDGATPQIAFHRAVVSGISAQDRAHIAFTMMLHTPREVSSFLQTLAQAQARAALGRPLARHVRQRARVLRRSARRLKAGLRALQG